MNAFPAFFKVVGKACVVFGGSEEAFAKVRLLLNTNADVRVVADRLELSFAGFLDGAGIEVFSEDRRHEAMEGAALAFAASGDAARDAAFVDYARSLCVPVNAVDEPELCDFYTPAIVNRAPVAVAIGTEGAGPVLAQMIRAQVDQLLHPSLGALARLAMRFRNQVESSLPRGSSRREFWRRFFSGKVADAVYLGDLDVAERSVSRLLQASSHSSGYVWLVGAGPGAEDLLTLRAQRALMEADVVLYDALVPQTIVDMGRRDAVRISVGKRKGCHAKSQDEINDLLVQLANQGQRVVRLKSGDPLVFGRAGEEMAALRQAGVEYEVVPGITSALAAAADFELPLTLRGVASSLVFTTGHDMAGDVLPDWARLAVSGATIAVYMGRSVAASVASRLMQGGMPEETPVAVVENASRTNRRLYHGTLGDLPTLESRTELAGPVMVIIGEAVAGADIGRSTALARAQIEVPQEILQ